MLNKKIAFSIIAVSMPAVALADVFHTPVLPSWTRPTDSTQADSSLTTYEEWDGFAVQTATNDPTGPSAFDASLSVPTAGDSTAAADDSFIIPNGTASNSYYTNASVGDIYSASQTTTIAPQINVPGYGIAGNQVNMQIEVQWYGAPIDANDLTVNGVPASNLANYSHSQVYNDGGNNIGFGFAYVADELWTFSLPDTTSLQLNFGWDALDSAIEVASVDTQSVVTAPEPASLGLLGIAAVMLPRRRCRR
ncbi:MAG TPA: PEP-CTERM sorting domain-containing protein [Tepidisphaeraceae bacterium]|jgi:hypothetical protein